MKQSTSLATEVLCATGELGYKVYSKVSGLSPKRNKQQQTLVEKQRKGLWRQNSLD
jgi:hypothetical protein